MFFSKTKYENRKLNKWEIILIFVMIGLALGLKVYHSRWPKADIRVGEETIKVLIANTPRHLYDGLGGKKDMGKYSGMLFMFSNKGQHTMVMRDMKFPIDIVWLDGGNIIDIAPNVQPEINVAEGQLIPYFSRLPSTMVLELPAGFVKKNKLKIGDRIEFAQ